jgi:hypothetical protein
VHHLVVVDGEKLIGMLSVFDLLQVIESIGSAESPPA